jgi:enoyl-CoA hydratase/carnithine racemase
MELILTGRMMSAAEAERWGLLNRVASPADLLDVAIDIAREIVKNAPLAVAASLELAKATADLSDATLGKMSRAALARLATSEDYGEGPRAFLEKRVPIWKGR